MNSISSKEIIPPNICVDAVLLVRQFLELRGLVSNIISTSTGILHKLKSY